MPAQESQNASLYQISITTIDGAKTTLADKKGWVLLVVNVASKCGFTSQYKGLEELYQSFKEKKFAVLGFPCNQFGGQEPGSESEIKKFCELKYQVTFPMFSKVEVNGANTHPLYQYLKSNSQKKGLLVDTIKWNFTKFLIDRQGNIVERFSPATTPEELKTHIQKLL